MDDRRFESVDGVVLAWLLVPRKKPSTGALAKAIAPLLGAPEDVAKKSAKDALARLKAQGFIERDTVLMLTQEGRQQALASLELSALPKRVKVDWEWVKRLLVLRALGVPVSQATITKSGRGAWLATRVVISHHKLRFGNEAKEDPTPIQLIAALAWKTIGRDEGGAFDLKRAFGPLLLRGGPHDAADPQPTAPVRGASVAAPTGADGLRAFAESVRSAAQASPTGRWHGNKVFISHVWKELRRRGGAGAMSFDDFQGRLVEANRAGLLELSRADLVQAMPREDVAASETQYLNASFHFVRLDDR